MKTFRCVTFGCRVNQYETQAIREQLEREGLSEAMPGEPANIVMVNSCTVTEAADRDCLSQLRLLHAENPLAKIVVTGCLVQRDAALLRDLPGIRLLVGTGQKHRIGEWVRSLIGPCQGSETLMELELSRVYGSLQISRFDGREKAFVKVQDGCDRACAFCKIPLVRGRSRSRELGEVLEEVRRLTDAGFREVVLTGVAIGLWGKEFRSQRQLADLVRAVDRLPGRFRIRLSSLDPRDLDSSLLDILGSSSKLCRYLHLSLQSGSDPVLARMNRGHTTAQYAGQLSALRRFWPDAGLTTDLIAGFPGETEEQFRQTLEFCQEQRFAKVHVFPYSRRRGTSGALFKEQLPAAVVRERARLLRQTADETARRFREPFVGTDQEILVEKNGENCTSQFLRVRLEGEPGPAGELVPVRITGLTPGGLRAKILRDALDKLTHLVPFLGWQYNLEQDPVTKANYRQR